MKGSEQRQQTEQLAPLLGGDRSVNKQSTEGGGNKTGLGTEQVAAGLGRNREHLNIYLFGEAMRCPYKRPVSQLLQMPCVQRHILKTCICNIRENITE